MTTETQAARAAAQLRQAVHDVARVDANRRPGGTETADSGSGQHAGLDFDPTLPNVARIYDWLLGGKDNFAADRQAAAKLLEAVPGAASAACENRAFLGRAVRFLAEEAGVCQFLDIGAGLPTAGSVHQIAQARDPRQVRVVYADYDPVVVCHAEALLGGSLTATVVHADLRQPWDLLARPAVRTLINLAQPVAILLVAVLHFIPFSDRFKINMCSDLLLYVVNMFATCMAAVGLMRVRTLAWMREPGYVMVCGA